MSEELKPCPFCGGEASWCGDDPDDVHNCHYIVCISCYVNIDFRNKECANAETIEGARAAALKAWNTREGKEND